MKMRNKTKQKMAIQRLKRIKSYYNAYCSGDTLHNRKLEKFILLLKHEYNDEYYFIVQSKSGELFLQKLVYNGSVNIVNVSRDGKQYAKNSCIFDCWFKEAEAKCNIWIKSYYNKTPVGIPLKAENYILALKKEYNGKYYFVLRNNKCKCLIAKLSYFWHSGVRVNIISAKEFDENKSVFYTWIDEAKSQGR